MSRTTAGIWAALALTPVLHGCSGDREIQSPAPLASALTIDYPVELWDQDIEGRCLLKVRVNELGEVDSVLVLESSGHAAFDSAAVRGARDMRFSPARRGDKRIRVWAHVPVHFSKRDRPR